MSNKILLMNIEYTNQYEGERLFTILDCPFPKIECISQSYGDRMSFVDSYIFNSAESHAQFTQALSNAIFSKSNKEKLTINEQVNLMYSQDSYTIYVLYETEKKSLKTYKETFHGSMIENKQYQLAKLLTKLPWKLSMIGIIK